MAALELEDTQIKKHLSKTFIKLYRKWIHLAGPLPLVSRCAAAALSVSAVAPAPAAELVVPPAPSSCRPGWI